jgi:large subunit ribosomal protein L17
MRHNNAGKKFSRTPTHRKALLRNLAKALLNHGRIRTTETKAKALRCVVEPLITLALRNDLHARRQAYRVLGNHSLVKRLFDEIGPLFAGIPGGYTRVVKLALPRRGDSAPLAFIELTRKPKEALSAQETKMLTKAAETIAHAVSAPKALETAEEAPPAPSESATPASEALIEVEAPAQNNHVKTDVPAPEESKALEKDESSETGDKPSAGTS